MPITLPQKLPGSVMHDPDSLAEFFYKHHVHPQAVDLLKGELIDGEAILTYTEEGLTKLGVKAGPRAKLMMVLEPYRPIQLEVLTSGEAVPLNVVTSKTIIDAEAWEQVTLPSEEVNEQESILDDLTVPSTVMNHFNSNSKELEKIVTNDITLFDVRQWIKDHDNELVGKKSLELILDEGTLQDTERQLFVRVIVAKLIELKGWYPDATDKTKLAMSIIHHFPKLKSKLGSGYEHYYNQRLDKGFIAFRFKTIRKSKLTSAQKKKSSSAAEQPKKRHIDTTRILSDEIYQDKVAMLQFQNPATTMKQVVIDTLAETFMNRQKWFLENSNLTVGEILHEFPSFKDFEGEMILREFKLLNLTVEDGILTRIPSSYQRKLNSFCQSRKTGLWENVRKYSDSNMRAMFILCELLPRANFRRNNQKKQKLDPSTSIPNANFLRFVGTQDDFARLTAQKDKGTHQPIIICSCNDFTTGGSFFIKSDEHVFAVGDNFLIAFDIFVKFHYCFDIEFPNDLAYFYNFVTSIIMELPGEKMGACQALDTSLMHINHGSVFPNDPAANDEI